MRASTERLSESRAARTTRRWFIESRRRLSTKRFAESWHLPVWSVNCGRRTDQL